MDKKTPETQEVKAEEPSKEKKDGPLWQIVEAVLFSTNHALSIPQIKKITGIKEGGKIPAIITDLNNFYKKHNRTFLIKKVSGGFQLRTDSRYQKWIKKGRIIKPIQLSPSVMETLAIVAYKQPVTRVEIEEIRTVDCTYALRSLLDKKLLRITGRKEIAGRPILYGTTNYFLEVFGFNTLNDLPRPEEFDILPGLEADTEIVETED